MTTFRLLNTEAAAELLNLRPCTLERWRWAGQGPTYRKVGRQVRYAEHELIDWLDRHKHQSTSEPNQAA